MVAIILSVFLAAVVWAVVVFLELPFAIAIITTAALALAWALALGLRQLKAAKAAGELEKGLQSQAKAEAESVRPEQQAEIEAMQEEFSRAVQALKASKLGRSGRDALALLPWYLIIGPPGGGKSTALRASGLKFPYLSKKRGGVRGLGGTRNCEWWLTNEAVLLDTAGRWTTEDEDHEEWESFLGLLARTRPRKPINGLIVAVPIADLGAKTDEEATEQGRAIRERVDEVMSRLKVVLPVYLLLTKCDLLPGFVEMFGDLRRADRGQVWGFTVPLSEGGGDGERAETFPERFDELLAAMEERALRRLGEERQQAARERIYELPQQLAAMKPPLAAFTEGLFAANVFQDAPIFRGVYLTSGTQEGRVIDRVMEAMARAFGVSPAAAEAEPVVEVKSYFLHDVFSKVVIPDQGIAFRSAKAVRSEAVRRWALAGAGALGLLLFLAFPLRTFLESRELVLSTGDIAVAAASRVSGAKPAAALVELEPLRERTEALLARSAETGPTLARLLGLERGEELLASAGQLYGFAVRRLAVEPIFRRDTEEMEELVRRLGSSGAAPENAEHGRLYEALKLHLLLTAPRGPSEPLIGSEEQVWIGQHVAERWAAGRGADSSAQRRLEPHARLFARLLARDPALALLRSEDLLKGGRALLGRSLPSLAEERLAAEVDGQGYDLGLTAMLASPLASLRAAGVVRGAYTRRAYEEVIKERLKAPEKLVELWVVGGKEGDESTASERLSSRYFERYIDAWEKFLDGVAVDGCAIGLLQELTRGKPPPLGRLFRAVAENTRFGGPAAGPKAEGGLLEKGRELGRQVRRQVDKLSRAPRRGLDVEVAFAGFAQFGAPPAESAGANAAAPLPLDAYQEQLVILRDALAASSEGGGEPGALAARVATARKEVRNLIGAQDNAWRQRFEALLLPPIEAATATTKEEVSKEASAKWRADVVSFFRGNLEPRYPFAPDGDDAAMADVAEFFRPSSGKLWRFHSEALSASVKRTGETFQFTGPLGGGFRDELLPFLNRAEAITSALFPASAAEPKVDFQVRIRAKAPIASVYLELDGQRVEYLNGIEEFHKLTWPGPGKPGALLRATLADGREQVVRREGEWGLFHLLEAGASEPTSSHDFKVDFPMHSLGAAVAIDVHTRSDNPFLNGRQGSARVFAPLRAGPSIPLEIGSAGGRCR